MAYESCWELLTANAIRYADAENDQEFRLARDTLRKAALKYALEAFRNRDPEVRILIVRRRPCSCHPHQLCLWPVQVRGMQSVTMQTFVSTG